MTLLLRRLRTCCGKRQRDESKGRVTSLLSRFHLLNLGKEREELEDFSGQFDDASSNLLAQFDICYNRLALLRNVKDAYEKKVSFTLGGDIQFECRKCVGYGPGKNCCPSVVLRDSGNASDRCDECSKLHMLHEQWIDGRKKRATS